MTTIWDKVRGVLGHQDLLPRQIDRTVDEVVTLIKDDILPKYKKDLIDLILLQPVQFVTTNNVIGLIRGMKTEWGVQK